MGSFCDFLLLGSGKLVVFPTTTWLFSAPRSLSARRIAEDRSSSDLVGGDLIFAGSHFGFVLYNSGRPRNREWYDVDFGGLTR
jgi:hypothetical protein